MGKLICLDPGHGGTDQGYTGYPIAEKDIMLDLAYRVEKILAQCEGIEVTLTRAYDVDLTIKERVEWANQKKADLFISLHTQSLSECRENGFTSYVSVFSDTHVRLYQCWVHNQIVNFLRQYQILDLGKKNDTETRTGHLKELRKTKMPAIALASLFITYPYEGGLWTDLSFRNQYAQCISEGLIRILQKP